MNTGSWTEKLDGFRIRITNMDKNLKKQVWGVLEDYGFFQKYKFHSWDREYRDKFFEDFLIIAKRYAEQKRKGVII